MSPLFVDFCVRASEGTTNRRYLQEPKFLAQRMALPPLDEQRRIVSRIEELASKLEQARAFRHDALAAAKKLVTAEAEAYFRELAAKNGIGKFSDLAPHVTSGPRNWGAYYSDSGTRFYRAQDISADFQIAHGSKVYVSTPANGQAEGAKLQPGDLMLVITGATVGRCTLFPSGGEPGLVNQHVALCRFPKESVVPEYVLWGLRSQRGQELLLGQRYGQGKPGLNLNNIRALQLPFPSMDDQRRTVAHLDSFLAKVDSLKKLQSETAAQLDALIPSILSKAFRGEL
jgi:type I restriction enzyme S subunit